MTRRSALNCLFLLSAARRARDCLRRALVSLSQPPARCRPAAHRRIRSLRRYIMSHFDLDDVSGACAAVDMNFIAKHEFVLMINAMCASLVDSAERANLVGVWDERITRQRDGYAVFAAMHKVSAFTRCALHSPRAIESTADVQYRISASDVRALTTPILSVSRSPHPRPLSLSLEAPRHARCGNVRPPRCVGVRRRGPWRRAPCVDVVRLPVATLGLQRRQQHDHAQAVAPLRVQPRQGRRDERRRARSVL